MNNLIISTFMGRDQLKSYILLKFAPFDSFQAGKESVV